MDGAVSFCGSEAEQAILETCRVAKRRLIITVSHRAWMVPVWLSSSLEMAGRFLPAVYAMFDDGEWHQDRFPENAMLTKGSHKTTSARSKPSCPTNSEESWNVSV